MVKPVRKSSSKNPPIFSHEFIIQNHADIVSCIAMVFVVGLLVPSTAPYASIFIAPQYNTTEAGEVPMYSTGIRDWATVFFYSLICIVIQAIIQEYVLDKVSKRFHLSKSKLAIFNTSGQMAIYYTICNIWGYDIIFREKFLPNISNIWADYPAPMSFMVKIFLIVQISHALHEIPELYFQRTKKEEYTSRIIGSLITLIVISVPYFLNFNRLLICLIVQHYTCELFIHISQLVQTLDKEERFTKLTHLISSAVMVATRVVSIILAVLTLWFGLAQGEQKEFDFATGYFNTPLVRVSVLGGVILLQMFLTSMVIRQQIQAAKESKTTATPINATKQKSQKKEKTKKAKRSDESDLPEVDQNTNKNLLRSRAQKAK